MSQLREGAGSRVLRVVAWCGRRSAFRQPLHVPAAPSALATRAPSMKLREAEEYFKLRRQQDKLAKAKDPKKRKIRKDKETATSRIGGLSEEQPPRVLLQAAAHGAAPIRRLRTSHFVRGQIVATFASTACKIVSVVCRSAK